MMSIRSLADFNRSSLGGDSDWLIPPPSPPRPQTPGRHDERGMGTFNWPPARTSTWPLRGLSHGHGQWVKAPPGALTPRRGRCVKRAWVTWGRAARDVIRDAAAGESGCTRMLSALGRLADAAGQWRGQMPLCARRCSPGIGSSSPLGHEQGLPTELPVSYRQNCGGGLIFSMAPGSDTGAGCCAAGPGSAGRGCGLAWGAADPPGLTVIKVTWAACACQPSGR